MILSALSNSQHTSLCFHSIRWSLIQKEMTIEESHAFLFQSFVTDGQFELLLVKKSHKSHNVRLCYLRDRSFILKYKSIQIYDLSNKSYTTLNSVPLIFSLPWTWISALKNSHTGRMQSYEIKIVFFVFLIFSSTIYRAFVFCSTMFWGV